MTDHVPVLVVGGGLTGLSAALFLGRQGIRSLVVERRPSTSRYPKARGFNARTMELLRNAGLEDRVLRASAELRDNHDILLCETLAQPPFQRVTKSRNDSATSRLSPSQEVICTQQILEPILLDEARALGADVRFGSVLDDFEQVADGVTATFNGDSVRADYVIACDGAQSSIRQRLGIAMTGDSATFFSVGISFVADLADLAADPFILAYVMHPEATGVMLPINNRDRWVFHVRFDPTVGQTAADFTPEHCKRLIRIATGRPELNIELVSVAEWQTTCLLADRYRDGRIFIAGDAAHLMPPAGALGANTAIQDAHNLAWKLAFVLHGLAGPALLDTYEAERRPVGKMALDQAMLRWHTRERHSGDENFVDDLTLMFGGQYVSRAVSNQQPVCRPKAMQDGTPGTRAPHVWLDDGTSTLDVYGPGFTLLHNDTRWVTTAATLQTPVTSCRVDQLGRQALLVRPDGYVAWRGDSHAHLPVVLAEILDNAGIAT